MRFNIHVFVYSILKLSHPSPVPCFLEGSPVHSLTLMPLFGGVFFEPYNKESSLKTACFGASYSFM